MLFKYFMRIFDPSQRTYKILIIDCVFRNFLELTELTEL